MIKEEFKPNAQVLGRIAEAFYQNNLIKKTQLHSASRTDWNSFERYMDWLQAKNYIEHHDTDEHVYKLTNGGREMFNMVIVLHDSMKKFRSLISA